MITLYNTISRKKETFEPVEQGKVKMYVCGPTTYNYIHLGNARPIIVFDVIRRYFQYRGYHVQYIQNFTDIDDKIVNKATEEKLEPLALSAKYIQEYFYDADRMNVKRADVHPKVSEHISEIIQLVEKLIALGYAYDVDGDVYFNVRKFEDYGKLSGRSLEELKAGARIQIDERKQDPLDFALWKKAKPKEIAWPSPWGEGRPGWHIECSAMSLKYLGETFDIHGGGSDLVFPHHENEIAQSRACGNCGFAKYWMHNGFITVNKEKMSKSLGNFFLVRDILEKFSPAAVRLYLLSTHYRSPLDFDDGKLQIAEKNLDKFSKLLWLFDEKLNMADAQDGNQQSEDIAVAINSLKTKFQDAMDDDFNTALAIAALFDFSREINGLLNREDFTMNAENRGALTQAKALFEQYFTEVLGLIPLGKTDSKNEDADRLVEPLMELIMALRAKAREEKQWKTADQIRDTLKEIGITLEDTPQGTKWRKEGM